MLFALAACGPAAPPPQPAVRFASAEQVEENFRGKAFLLGDNDKVALVRQTTWPTDHFLQLPFWLGTNILLPGVLQPKQGDYYVISEAYIVRQLDNPDEWLIDAGSSLLKKETVFITTRTRYKSPGRILPTVVQYVGSRSFWNTEGKLVEIPVLREVSLPMRWTAQGGTPKVYARFQIR